MSWDFLFIVGFCIYFVLPIFSLEAIVEKTNLVTVDSGQTLHKLGLECLKW